MRYSPLDIHGIGPDECKVKEESGLCAFHHKKLSKRGYMAMYKVDNRKMLEFFQGDNEIRHYFACLNIINAGKKGHGIKSVEYYTGVKDMPMPEYVEFTAYVFGELIVKINTFDVKLIEAACKKIIEIHKEYDSVSIETPTHMDLSDNGTIQKYFDLSNSYESESCVYGLLSPDKVPHLEIPQGIDIHTASSDEIEMIKGLDNRQWCGIPMMLSKVYNQQADFLFLLYFENQLAGILCANNKYKNFYEIIIVFVHKGFRGKKLGTLLTTYLARHCLDNGLYPHYGAASSKYSENVAASSGFEEISRTHGFVITPKQG